MAGVKTADERGHPAAQWLVDARAAVGLSDSEVVERLGKYSEATLRKAEAHSDNISRPMWLALVPMYQAAAIEKGITLRPPPTFSAKGKPAAEPDLASAIREQAAAIDRLVDALTQDRKDGPPWVDALVAALRASPAGSDNGGSDERRSSGALRPDR